VPAYPLRALVLRKTKLGEADLILTLLAADGSQVRAVAKGARKPKSRFGARVEPYTVLDMLLHTGRSLEVIAEAQTVRSHDGLRADFDRTMHAAVVVDLLDKASVEGQTDERLFGLALATLDALEEAPLDELLVVTDAFLIKAMAMMGYRPQLLQCVDCGAEASGGLFSLEQGGILCEGCADLRPAVLPLSPQVRNALSALLSAKMADVASFGIPLVLARECFTLLRAFVGFHVPARLKALEFLTSAIESS
jgi:DNA repair protein RecO (recombination protein O)